MIIKPIFIFASYGECDGNIVMDWRGCIGDFLSTCKMIKK